ncbi:hypothetical protein Tco_0896400 [Tanacetum coccineum]
MTSPNKPTSKPSRVAKMSVKPIWRKKPNLCNTSNVLNTTSPIPKPLTPHHEPSQENNHPNQALPNPYIKDTPTSPQVVSHPPLPISPINSHIAHTQAPPQSNNQTQHTPPLSPSRESLVDDINQLQDLSNLLAMHLTQQQNNIPSSPYSPNLPHTLNINQVETHVGQHISLKSFDHLIIKLCFQVIQALFLKCKRRILPSSSEEVLQFVCNNANNVLESFSILFKSTSIGFALGIGVTVGFVSEDEDGKLDFEEFSEDIKEDEIYFCSAENSSCGTKSS